MARLDRRQSFLVLFVDQAMDFRRLYWQVLFLAAVSLLREATAWQGEDASASSNGLQPGDLRAAGKIEFPISSATEVRPEFERGVALLHSFFYEEARRS